MRDRWFTKRTFVQSLFPLLISVAGCSTAPSEPDNLLQQGASFVSVRRTLGGDVVARRQGLRLESVPGSDATESFYLAINKKDLNKRYFLSAYMKQNSPGRPSGLAALSMGVKVVTFRVQNGKLFVFDAGDGKALSDTFDPTLIVEAYPLVEGYAPFTATAGSEQYVLVDPAAGLNRFGMVSDVFADARFNPVHFQIDLSFLQAFRRIADGVTFEQVFTGSVADPVDPPSPDAPPPPPGNAFTVSGTLAIGLREYREGAGFQPLLTDRFDSKGAPTADSPALPPFFFTTDPLTDKNEGTQRVLASKFNIHKGMKPIEWRYSRGFRDIQKELPQYDFISAIRAGVEGWNAVFGFPAFKAVEAGPDDSFADDDKNFIIFDADPTLTFAFADFRKNPNSGEVRGATVYFGSFYFRLADEEFAADAGAPAAAGAKARARTAKPRALPQLTWGDLRPQPLCVLDGQRMIARGLAAADAGANAKALTKKEKVEKFITHLVAHEVGHTLGLRHNFKGSLNQQSSLMEYILDRAIPAAGRDQPGPYDIDAIKLLYGLSKKQPAQPFCTDDGLERDPDCNTFDRGADPLNQFYGPAYQAEVSDLVHAGTPDPELAQFVDDDLNQIADWLRAGTPVQQLQAFTYVNVAPVGVDFSAEEAKSPGFLERLDALAAGNVRRLFLDGASRRGEIKDDVRLDGTLLTAVLHELDGVVRNVDKYRSYETRRTVVDVLKQLQLPEALAVLTNARQAIVAERAALPAGSIDASLVDDLLVRIDVALHPYFLQ
jgi:hypothetical protein